ncbi:hypothetical protein [Algoriphagus sp.]|uniref:hypothetical protein n=1 Tax=Algoriphagus sp. TaxID=1872435 RepID=UPI003F6FCDD8
MKYITNQLSINLIWRDITNWGCTTVVLHAKMANAQISTFACPQADASQAKEPVFLPTLNRAKFKLRTKENIEIHD